MYLLFKKKHFALFNEADAKIVRLLQDEKDKYHDRDGLLVDVSLLSEAHIKKLTDILNKHKSDGSIASLIRDLDLFIGLNKDSSKVKPRTPDQFRIALSKEMLKRSKILYKKNSDDNWDAYYVCEIAFHPKNDYRGGNKPAYTDVKLAYRMFGQMVTTSVEFRTEHCCYQPVQASLEGKGYYFETPSLQKEYEATQKKFDSMFNKIGTQYWATGYGTTEPGNSYYYRTKLPLFRAGKESKVLMDVFFEEEDKERTDASIDPMFWLKEEHGEEYTPTDEEMKSLRPSIPNHHYVAVFDLARHERLQTHINNLTPYVYNTKLSEELVLPEIEKSLVEILVRHKDGGFHDIVSGKSGGATVILCGPPGCGKTLTAEVVAESESKPLYSVQCAQLGIKLDELEGNLEKAFARARRWNAVLLLDEADVYVRARGGSLTQNAIVGTFLRLMEYQTNIMFLTTNLPDDIDDAILSRCIARINYGIPNRKERQDIWNILCRGNRTKIAEKDITSVLDASEGMSGRDIKNVLKLILLLNKPIDAQSVEYAKKFKPTIDIDEDGEE